MLHFSSYVEKHYITETVLNICSHMKFIKFHNHPNRANR